MKTDTFLKKFDCAKYPKISEEIYSAIPQMKKYFTESHNLEARYFDKLLGEYMATIEEILTPIKESDRGLFLKEIIFYLLMIREVETEGQNKSPEKTSLSKNIKLLKAINAFLNSAKTLQSEEKRIDGTFFSKAIHPSNKLLYKSNFDTTISYYKQKAENLKIVTEIKTMSGPKKRTFLSYNLRKLDSLISFLIYKTKYKPPIRPLAIGKNGERDFSFFEKQNDSGSYKINSLKMLTNGLYLTGLIGSYKENDIRQALLISKKIHPDPIKHWLLE